MNLIEQSLREAIDEAAAGDDGFCVTIEDPNDDSRWVQLTWDSLNFAYPLAGDPLQALAQRGIALPALVEVSGWEAGKFVTFEHGVEPMGALVDFIEAYLETILGLDPRRKDLKVTKESL